MKQLDYKPVILRMRIIIGIEFGYTLCESQVLVIMWFRTALSLEGWLTCVRSVLKRLYIFFLTNYLPISELILILYLVTQSLYERYAYCCQLAIELVQALKFCRLSDFWWLTHKGNETNGPWFCASTLSLAWVSTHICTLTVTNCTYCRYFDMSLNLHTKLLVELGVGVIVLKIQEGNGWCLFFETGTVLYSMSIKYFHETRICTILCKCF